MRKNLYPLVRRSNHRYIMLFLIIWPKFVENGAVGEGGHAQGLNHDSQSPFFTNYNSHPVMRKNLYLLVRRSTP